MKIYLAIYQRPYQETEILGIFNTPKKAKKCCGEHIAYLLSLEMDTLDHLLCDVFYCEKEVQ